MARKHQPGVRKKPSGIKGSSYQWVTTKSGRISVWGGGKYHRHKRA